MAEDTNIYGVDLAIGPTGDLVVNSAGALTLLGDVDVCAQAILLRLRTGLGDLVLHPTYGSDLPIGDKLNPEAIAAAVNGELASMVANDSRFATARVIEVQSPVNENTSAVQLGVKVVLAGGESFTVIGLPAEARVSEVELAGSGEGETALTPFEEEEFFTGEDEGVEPLTPEEALESLINDLPGE